MAFERTSAELVDEILELSGETTDGTSDYEDLALRKLNNVYKGLLSGGSEFGVDIAEPWVWAQAKKPIILELKPTYEGTATLTNGSWAGTFSVAPSYSLEGRFFRVDSRADIYRIASHTAASTSFSLDQAYLDDSGTVTFSAYKLDYDLTDDVIIVDSTNNKINFKENSVTELTATLTSGVYSPTTFCTEVDTRLTAAGAQSYTISFDSVTRKFSLVQGGTYFRLLFGTGTNANVSAAGLLGFDDNDQISATTYTSQYAKSGILRITKPITIFQDSSAYNVSNRESGKVFLIDSSTFLREYPLTRITEEIPDKFCLIDQNRFGVCRARFNTSVSEDSIRAEVEYIPVPRSLFDNSASIPLVPGSYADYLVFAATHYVLLDKSDNKSEKYFQLAQAKLQSMLNDARKGKSSAGLNFGKLVPRKAQSRNNGWFR
jgi:hypothetical protein